MSLLACHASGTGPAPPVLCTDDAASTYEAPSSLVGPHGTVLRCSTGAALAAADVDRIARTSGYVGSTLPSGAQVIRVLYKTERGDTASTAGFGSAVVLLPDRARASSVPVVVVAHGTVGEAPGCPPSQEGPTLDATYLAELGYPLVGAGYAVILPDFAGYAGFGTKGNSPSGYHASADEARSVLDAARALRQLRPGLFTNDTVLVGHSQGGHAVLSAMAEHAAYGSGGALAGVITYAPSWFSMASFGALLATPTDYPLATEYDTAAATVWYHYSHAELFDGPGAGELLFAAGKRDAIRQFFERSCNASDITQLGTTVGDLFDPTFSAEVAFNAGLGTPCTRDPCAKWTSRYSADRPHLTGVAKTVPLLVVYGDADDWIPADRETCGFDRLESDGANATFCIVPGAKHDPVVGARAEYVSSWIDFQTHRGPDPGVCGRGRDALVDDAGAVISCASPPPNN